MEPGNATLLSWPGEAEKLFLGNYQDVALQFYPSPECFALPLFILSYSHPRCILSEAPLSLR